MSSEQDLVTNLLGTGKKGNSNYKKRIEEIQLKIRVLRNKNNMFQKQSDNDIDGDIKKQIYDQSKFIEEQIQKIKEALSQFCKKFTDPTSKNKGKQLWNQLARQIERNKIIMQRLIAEAPRQSYFIHDPKMRSSIMEYDERKRKNSSSVKGSHIQNGRQSILSENVITQQHMDISQVMIEQQIQKKKGQLLTHLQQKNNKINKVMNEIALIVNSQGEDINMITDNMNKAVDNVEQANQNLDDAAKYQRKAKRKCCIIAGGTVLVCLLVMGVVFLLTNSS